MYNIEILRLGEPGKNDPSLRTMKLFEKGEESKIKIEILGMVPCKSWQPACKAIFASILSGLGTKKALIWQEQIPNSN